MMVDLAKAASFSEKTMKTDLPDEWTMIRDRFGETKCSKGLSEVELWFAL